jgi:CHASE3 domain sensor protein
MTNLLPHRRFHIPNGLAIFAAVLLVVTSVVGFETSQKINSSGQEATTSMKVNTDTDDSISDSVEHKRRGLNLGLLLFRRG